MAPQEQVSREEERMASCPQTQPQRGVPCRYGPEEAGVGAGWLQGPRSLLPRILTASWPSLPCQPSSPRKGGLGQAGVAGAVLSCLLLTLRTVSCPFAF